MSRVLLFVLAGLAPMVAVFTVADAQGGAWTQAPGATFLKVSALTQTADQRWECRGTSAAADPAGDFVSRQLFVYLERGWTPRVTVLGSFSYKDQRIDGDLAYGTRSTGDLRVGTRVSMLGGRRPVALEATISLPTYPRTDLESAVEDREQFLPAGSGRVETELHVTAGTSFFPWPLYGNLDVGYRERGGDFTDQWLVAAEVGASGPRVFAKTELRWALPHRETCDAGAVGSVALHQRAVQLAPEAAVRVKGDWWLSLGYAHALAGRNTLQGGQWSLGLIFWQPGA